MSISFDPAARGVAPVSQSRGWGFSNLRSTLARVALFAIPVIVVLGSLSKAEAGPLAYTSCMVGCAAMGPFAAACWPACLPILALPTP